VGGACTNARGRTALAKLRGAPWSSEPMRVRPAMTRPSLHLCRRSDCAETKTLFGKTRIPDIAGGYILAEQAKRAITQIRCQHMLATISIRENFRFADDRRCVDQALIAVCGST